MKTARETQRGKWVALAASGAGAITLLFMAVFFHKELAIGWTLRRVSGLEVVRQGAEVKLTGERKVLVHEKLMELLVSVSIPEIGLRKEQPYAGLSK